MESRRIIGSVSLCRFARKALMKTPRGAKVLRFVRELVCAFPALFPSSLLLFLPTGDTYGAVWLMRYILWQARTQIHPSPGHPHSHSKKTLHQCDNVLTVAPTVASARQTSCTSRAYASTPGPAHFSSSSAHRPHFSPHAWETYANAGHRGQKVSNSKFTF